MDCRGLMKKGFMKVCCWMFFLLCFLAPANSFFIEVCAQPLLAHQTIDTNDTKKETVSLEQMVSQARKIKNENFPIQNSIEKISELFLSRPFKNAPLGEGKNGLVDKDPLFRFDVFDCVTFVEETLALTLENDTHSFEEVLALIRYKDGKISYPTRHHFMMSQWIPENIRQGFVKDITAVISPDFVQESALHVTKTNWKEHKIRGVRLKPEEVPAGNFSLPYIPLQHFGKIALSIPTGSIIHIVRNYQYNTPYNITHQGFFIQKNQKPFIRHASLYHKRVVDEPLSKFLARNIKQEWPVLGIQVMEVKNPFQPAVTQSVP